MDFYQFFMIKTRWPHFLIDYYEIWRNIPCFLGLINKSFVGKQVEIDYLKVLNIFKFYSWNKTDMEDKSQLMIDFLEIKSQISEYTQELDNILD